MGLHQRDRDKDLVNLWTTFGCFAFIVRNKDRDKHVELQNKSLKNPLKGSFLNKAFKNRN